MSNNETKRGTITKIISEKGYGFIKEESGESLFFHASKVENPVFEELKENDTVEFIAIDAPKGLQATAVVKIN